MRTMSASPVDMPIAETCPGEYAALREANARWRCASSMAMPP